MTVVCRLIGCALSSCACCDGLYGLPGWLLTTAQLLAAAPQTCALSCLKVLHCELGANKNGWYRVVLICQQERQAWLATAMLHAANGTEALLLQSAA
jgi:hypothetical protein